MARRRTRRVSSRQLRRKFVWHREFGELVVGTTGVGGVDLLATYRSLPGATHVGATVMRIRGFIVPQSAVEAAGTIGFRIDQQNEDPTETDNVPALQPDLDWMGWLPWMLTSDTPNVSATWNAQANQWAVDIKSNRMLEELQETLWMFFDRPTAGTVTYNYNLSIGLKLP